MKKKIMLGFHLWLLYISLLQHHQPIFINLSWSQLYVWSISRWSTSLWPTFSLPPFLPLPLLSVTHTAFICGTLSSCFSCMTYPLMNLIWALWQTFLQTEQEIQDYLYVDVMCTAIVPAKWTLDLIKRLSFQRKIPTSPPRPPPPPPFSSAF